jgi:prevent-host-death family protein
MRQMKALTITAARIHFGALLKAVQREPILVYRRNGDKALIVSAENCRQIYQVPSFESEPVKRSPKAKDVWKPR